MVVPDGQIDTPLILVVADQAVWAEALEAILRQRNYHTTVASNRTEAQTQLRVTASGIEVIVVVASQESIHFIQKSQATNTSRLLILVVPDEAVELIDEKLVGLVDAVVPTGRFFLQTQIEVLIKMHFESRFLKSQVAALESEITEQKRLTGEIEILKNAIVRNVSHELRTPLLQVKSAVSLIKEEVTDQKLITYAENATGRLETHVKNITMLGHSLDINVGPIILRDAVEYARRNLGRVWQRKSEADRIVVQIDDNLPPVLADKQGLSTVLQLLMDNALKFSDDLITIIGRIEGTTVYVAVADQGIGIENDKLKDIFESFYQIDSSSTRRYGGAGVGLALVKLILDHLHSEIHVESKIGEGSVFWFLLPIVDMGTRTVKLVMTENNATSDFE